MQQNGVNQTRPEAAHSSSRYRESAVTGLHQFSVDLRLVTSLNKEKSSTKCPPFKLHSLLNLPTTLLGYIVNAYAEPSTLVIRRTGVGQRREAGGKNKKRSTEQMSISDENAFQHNTELVVQMVRQQFRKNMHETDPEKIQKMKDDAARGLINHILYEAEAMTGRKFS
ncbi:hypothetical protein M8C21_012998 [Ambrosia artemisiifolia]|uniref:Complex 1 LYR protein domain-containing protein n=1 Tax=Ambrosia artemisiifolia TaxID=4212 RepID=A0AAD5GMJ3_AMBAR|nr:hypothetical protein M8C21_012998 [Ambrosia artemisiifolia]